MSIKALQDYTFIAKYAQYKPEDKRRETWIESTDRVLEMHLKKFPQIEEDLKWAFERAKKKVALGSQRALQFGGADIEKKNAKMYNCIASYCDRPRFFQECLWLLLCGCGTGFSVQNHHIDKLPDFHPAWFEYGNQKGVFPTKTYVAEDSIEGWASCLGVMISSFYGGGDFPEYAGCIVNYDLSNIRPEGERVGSSKGKAPGPEPLRKALKKIQTIFVDAIINGQTRLKSINCYDIIMHASDAVLSGGIRRSATICLFSPTDLEMAQAKTGNWFIDNPQRGRSNNSVVLVRGETPIEEFQTLMGYVKEYGEPGFVWVDDKDLIVNPCVEIGFYPVDTTTGESGWQACVSGDTKLITKSGNFNIEDVVGENVEIWNGEGWKTVKPFKTGENRKLYRVKLKDGSFLDCTDNHKWLIKDRFQKKYSEVETKDLMSFSNYAISTPSSNFEWNGSIREDNAYELGFVLGDGCAKRTDTESGYRKPFATLFGHDHDLGLKCRTLNSSTPKGKYQIDTTNVAFDCLDQEFSYDLKYGEGLPQEIFKWDRKSCYDFIAGWMDADGTQAGRGFRIYGRKDKIADLQLLLTKLGFYSSLNLMREAGTETNYGISKQDVWYIQVNDVKDLYSRRINLEQTFRKQAGKGGSQIIKSVEKLPGLHDTFCVYEEEKNQCVFNNVLTKQCNLCEINGKYCSTPERFEEACRAAAIIGTVQAAYTDMSYLGETTENILKNEALLGVSITGMMDNPEILFDPKLQRKNAKIILKENERIAKLIGIKPTARATCIKPAGTTSCILGTSSGIHPHHAKRYIRRTQGNYLEHPIQHFKKFNSLAVEESVWSANKTDEVISFCVEVPVGSKTKNDIGAIELLELVKLTQQNWVEAGKVEERCSRPWLSHNVSNTVTIKDDEWEDVTKYIYKNRKWFAGISLLSISGDKDYAQAPFTAIYTPTELVRLYGDAAVFASGIITDALHAFSCDLWDACEVLLEIRNLEPLFSLKSQQDDYNLLVEKHEWVKKAKRFANRYFEGDIKKMTYCLKDVHNWKYWIDLNREYKDVDYTTMTEEEDNTKLLQASACAGGNCSLEYV